MEISNADLKNRLNANLQPQIIKKTYLIEKRNAIEFLTPERFDLLAKYLYIFYKERGIKSKFFEDLYSRHIEVFNGFYEADKSNKIGKEKFLKSFDDLILSIKEKGIDNNSLIPYSSDNTILDGAHRIAASIYFNLEIKCVDLNIKSSNFNYKYFEKLGLEREYLDQMVLEYINLKSKDLQLVFLWPTSGGKQEKRVYEIFEKYGKVVYRKDLYLTKQGSVNLIRNIYEKEKWVGNVKNNYIGAQNKAEWCFETKSPVRIFLFESDKDMIEMKDNIRKIFNVNKHSIHITDTIEEVENFSKLVFNSNTIHWLNYSITNKLDWFEKLFKHYNLWLTKNKLPFDDFCIDGSATLSVYGIRTARDLDFLYSGNKSVSTGFKEIDCHNTRLENDKTLIDEVVYNPNNYLYYKNLKFLSLQKLKDFKIKRSENKDLDDVVKIDALLKNKQIKLSINKQIKLLFNKSFWIGKVKFFLLKVRYHIVKLKKNAVER